MDIARHDNNQEIIRALEERRVFNAVQGEGQKLMAAVKENDIATVRQLIAEGVDADEKASLVGTEDDGYTPLLVAAREGYADVVWELLKAGANPRLVDEMIKATPGHKAGYQGRAEVAKVLVADGQPRTGCARSL